MAAIVSWGPGWMNRLVTWFAPEPGSRISEIIQQGKSPRMESVHLLWSAWIFVTPLFDRGYTWRWAILTALTYPLFVALFAKSMLVSRNVASRYGAALAVFGIALVPFYSGSVSYFIYGCVSCSLSSRRLAPFLLRLLLLNTVFLLTAWQVGMYGWMAIATFLIFGHEIEKTNPVFWFMMQIAMLIGFLTAYPVNWWLLRAGLKEKM